MRLGGRSVGIGVGGLLLLGVLSLVTGQNFFSILGPMVATQEPGPTADAPYQGTPEEERLVDFVSFVLDDAQRTWSTLLGGRYRDARLVLFTDTVRSECGAAQAAMGPFYCPLDERVYVDLGFYRELRERFGAPGDFAQAYVIAHEIGHHVQGVLGISEQVRRRQAERPGDASALSVRLELQADCLAGVWGHSTQKRDILERGDVDEGLAAAAAVGDDRIQRDRGGHVTPETWTHGSSRQRSAWFRHGLSSGRPDDCDTFGRRLPEEG